MLSMRTSVLLLLLIASSCALPDANRNLPQEPSTQAPTIFAENGPWIGLTATVNDAGEVVVNDIYWNSPADLAGIKPEDRIVSIDGAAVKSIDAIATALRGKTIGDRIAIVVMRTTKTLTFLQKDKPVELSPAELDAKYHEFLQKGKQGESLKFDAVKATSPVALNLTLSAAPKKAKIYAPPAPAPRQTGKTGGWLGISLDEVDLGTVGGKSGQKGVSLTTVYPNSPADKSGLKNGDVVVKYDGNALGDNPRATFVEFLKSKQGGETVSLEILRPSLQTAATVNDRPLDLDAEKLLKTIGTINDGEHVRATITKEAQTIAISALLGERTASLNAPPAKSWESSALHPELKDYRSDEETLARKIMAQTNITDKYEDLIKRYVEDERWDDGFRLSNFRYLHCNPFNIPKIGDDLLSQLRQSSSPESVNFHRLMITIAGMLDEDLSAAPLLSPLKTGISLEEHGKQIEELLRRAARFRDEAFAGLTTNDVQFISDNIYGLTDRLVKDTHLSDEEQIKLRGTIDKRLLDLLRYVDVQKLFLSAWVLTPLASPSYIEGLSKDIRNDAKAKTGSPIYSQNTEWGTIIFGGDGNDRYEQPAAVIIDIGGDDFYVNRREQPKPVKTPFSIIIDCAGNDRYSSYEYGYQGCGVMGVGMIVDMSGNDLYVAQDWGQGSGLLGVGILCDYSGNDTYKGQEYVQGAGFFGAGILIDGGGNDSYEANLYAQGFGLTKGFGVLIDHYGDDSYYASGKYRTGYKDNPGTFDGLSQGCGLGIRCYADSAMSRSGGIGVLLDGEGRDRYEAGTFSQGGGYYFGWGILSDCGNGNDLYIGTRYAQGFAAHSALGYFVDEGGDDVHRGLADVHSGLSWDLTCVVFIDKGGDDIYEGGGFSRGATAHNGFIIFHDMGGRDDYRGEAGRAGDNTYHGGFSLTLFIDEGGGQDSYSDKRENNSIEVSKEYSIFLDLKEPLRNLLSDESLPTKIKNSIK